MLNIRQWWKGLALRNFRFTLVGAAVGLLLYVVSMLLDFDLCERLVGCLVRLEWLELDELVVVLPLVAVGILLDVLFHLHSSSVQRHQEEIFSESMRATQHIVNNFLNNLLYIQMEIEENGSTAESRELFERLVKEASAQLKELSDLERAEATKIRKFYQLDRKKPPG